MIAREIGGKVIHADPLAPNYIENIRTVAEALAFAADGRVFVGLDADEGARNLLVLPADFLR